MNEISFKNEKTNSRFKTSAKPKKSTELVTKQQVMSMIKQPLDVKYVDTSATSYIPTYSYGAISSLTLPSQGTSVNQRVGDKIRLRNMEVKGQLYGAVSHICRIIFFLWKPNTTPSGSEILDSAYVSTFRAPFAPYNYPTKDNFIILDDFVETISATGLQNAVFHRNIDLKSRQITFGSGGGTGTFRPYWLMVADGVITLGTIDIVIRLHYYDD